MKVALVTGGSRGIGAETVRLFAQKGYTVILNYNNSVDAAQQLRGELLEKGCDVHLYQADVSDEKQVHEMFEWVEKYFKHLDVLVNNAGVSLNILLQETTAEQFDFVMNTNAKGAFLCCKYAAKMLVRQQYGSVVNVSSVWGLVGAANESVYSMSKHAVVGLTKSLAKEWQPSNICVNCICPPIVRTDMCSHLTKDDMENFQKENNLPCLLPQDVAKDILQLAECGQTGIILQEK